MKTALETVKDNFKATNKTLVIFSVLLFSYTAIRAFLLSITWDEAYSYQEFVRTGNIYSWDFNSMSANNHLLYTFLEILFTNLFGASEFVLRLPSLIAHILFLFYSAKLVKHFSDKWLVLASFLIINLNPYLLDFFSLARGYGLSLGLMMASIYYLYLFQSVSKNKFALLSLLFAALGVLANYVLLNYCLALFGVIMILLFSNSIKSDNTATQKRRLFLKGSVLPIVILSLLLLLVVPITLKLKEAGALFFGGNKSFWRDTISTIIDRSLYDLGYNHWFQRIVKGFVVVVLLSTGGFLALQFFKKQVSTNKLFLGSLFFIAGISITSTIIQHHFLGTLYLIDRTALFLLVLFNLLLVSFINELSKERKLFAWITHLFAVSLIIHFVLSFNFKYVLEWKLNADTKEMLTDLEKIKQVPKEKNNVSVGIPLMFETDINFYRDIKNLGWLNTVSRSTSQNMLEDYFYLTQKDLVKLSPDSIEIIKTYPLTKNVLAKPKYRFRNVSAEFDKELFFENEPVQRFFIESHIKYSPGITFILNDSIASTKNAVLVFKTKVMTYAIKNSNLSIVLSLQNVDGCYLWKNAYIRDYIKEENVWTDVYFSCIVPPEAKAGDELKVYIWNELKQELFIKSMNLKWLQYQ